MRDDTARAQEIMNGRYLRFYSNILYELITKEVKTSISPQDIKGLNVDNQIKAIMYECCIAKNKVKNKYKNGIIYIYI